MANPLPFVIPGGVRFLSDPRGVTIEHTGDILLEGPMGRDVERVVSVDGCITLRGPFHLERIEAPNGTVRVEGQGRAGHVLADVVEIVAPQFQARAVRARSRIVVGAIRIVADVLMAPQISIDPKATGRVPMVECHNVPGPNNIKGGFSVTEYGELLGDARKFLAERGLEPLEPAPEGREERGRAPPPVEPPPPREEIAALPALGETADDDDTARPENAEDSDTSPAPPPALRGLARDRAFVIVEDTPSEDEAEPPDEGLPHAGASASVAVGVRREQPAPRDPWEIGAASEPEAESSRPPPSFSSLDVDDLPLPPGAHHEIHQEAMEPFPASDDEDVPDEFSSAPEEEEEQDLGVLLRQALRDLRRFYREGSEPPPIGTLSSLVEQGSFEEIAERLPDLWNELVNHHRDHGIRIRRQVTTTFNDILSIVKRTPSVKID